MNVLSIAALLLAGAILTFFWVRKGSMTQGIVIANFAVFVLTLASSRTLVSIGGSPLLDDLAFRPRYLVDLEWSKLYTVVTAAFLHAGFLHILANMLILMMAGLPFEERLGRGRYLVVYFFSSIAAVLLHVVWVNYTSGPGAFGVPVVGASGAVFGILGGFAATYPRDQIPMFLIVIFLQRVPVILAAVVMAFVEVVALFIPADGGVAHAAHIGGVVGGAIVAPLVRVPRGKAATGMGSGRDIDFAVLGRLATDERTRNLIQRVKENSDAAELQKAWLDRLLVALRCPECSAGYAEAAPGVLECDNGHRVQYAR